MAIYEVTIEGSAIAFVDELEPCLEEDSYTRTMQAMPVVRRRLHAGSVLGERCVGASRYPCGPGDVP